jgi:hypothetical protein
MHGPIRKRWADTLFQTYYDLSIIKKFSRICLKCMNKLLRVILLPKSQPNTRVERYRLPDTGWHENKLRPFLNSSKMKITESVYKKKY